MRSVPNTVEKLLLAAPRGYCAGVDRAVQTVERALQIHGAPVYVRKEIVHNKHVVEGLRERGAIFVDEHTEVPEGAVCVFSAHGVAPSVREGAIERHLETIDATCPLVTKVHREAVRFANDGYTIVLVGHDGHEEVEGTMGEAPEKIVLVQNEQDVDALEIEDTEHIAYVTQTTLAVDETESIIERLRERFPSIVGPRTDDICYATTNRQAAVKDMAASCDVLLVIGSSNSSNSKRLVEVARDLGTEAYLKITVSPALHSTTVNSASSMGQTVSAPGIRARSCGVSRRPSSTVKAKRPPGSSTRATSPTKASLSGKASIVSSRSTTSKRPSGRGGT